MLLWRLPRCQQQFSTTWYATFASRMIRAWSSKATCRCNRSKFSRNHSTLPSAKPGIKNCFTTRRLRRGFPTLAMPSRRKGHAEDHDSSKSKGSFGSCLCHQGLWALIILVFCAKSRFDFAHSKHRPFGLFTSLTLMMRVWVSCRFRAPRSPGPGPLDCRCLCLRPP